MIGKTVSHYRILRKIGGGGMGVVFVAKDIRLGRQVALKFVREGQSAATDSLQRFALEARAASSLNHPNICVIHDIDQYQGRPFIVMEYLEGSSFTDLISQALPEAELRRIGASLADALDAAHSKGIVHRDIKPSNILLTEQGRPKILDFGLAKIDSDPLGDEGRGKKGDDLTKAGQVLGTLAYMSPEQANGQEVTGASDVFSLGIVLYQLATGRAPFEGDSPIRVLQAILSTLPLRPSTLNPSLNENTDAILLQMLAKDPQLRPSAADVRKELNRTLRVRSGAEIRTRPGRIHRTIGRTDEQDQLRRGLQSVRSDRGMLVCVTGEAGIGKTTFVETWLEETVLTPEPVLVGRGRCSERLVAKEAYIPFLEALEGLLRSSAGETVSSLMHRLAPTWYAEILPHESGISSASDAPRDGAASQERMKRELTSLLREMSRLFRLVLFLDDLHWADSSTVEMLVHLADRFDSIRGLIIAAYRPTDLMLTNHPFQDIKLGLEARGICYEIALDFLSVGEVDEYLSSEFPNHNLPSGFCEMIYARTEGSPLFMVDLVNYMRLKGLISRDPGRWSLTVPTAELEQGLPVSVRSMVRRKVEQIDEEQKRLLSVASLQGVDFDSALLSRVLEIDAAEVEERLRVLDQVHSFIRKAGEDDLPDGSVTVRYRFVHVLYQEALFSALQPTRRARLSALVAESLRGFYRDRQQEIAAQLGFLLEIARDAEGAAENFKLAAQKNARLFAFGEAAELAGRGLKLLEKLPGSPLRDGLELDLLLILGPSLMAQRGFAAQVVQKTYARARELCEQIGEEPRTIPALWGLWQYYVMRAELARARKLAQQVHRLACASEEADVLPEAFRALGETAHWRGDVARARTLLEEGIESYDAEKHRQHAFHYGLDPRVASLSILGWSLWTLGYPEQALVRAKQGISEARDLTHPFSLAYSSFALAGVHMFRREPRKALEIADQAIELSSEEGYPFWLATSTATKGWALNDMGHTDESVSQLREAIEIYRGTGAEIALPWFLYLLADTLARQGEYVEALESMSRSRSYLEKNGDRWWEAEVHRIHGEVLLAQSEGNADEAEARFLHSLSVARKQRARSWELRAAISLSRLLLGQGRLREARDSLEPVCGWFTEGLETRDFIQAQHILAKLAAPSV